MYCTFLQFTIKLVTFFFILSIQYTVYHIFVIVVADRAEASAAMDDAEEKRRAEILESRHLCFEGSLRDAALDEYTFYRLLRSYPFSTSKTVDFSNIKRLTKAS